MIKIEFQDSTEREAILQQYEQPPVSTITYIRDYEDGSGYVLVEQYTLEDIKNQKKQKIAQARYDAEIAGVTLEDGTIIATDRESQAALANAALIAKDNPDYTINWKAKNGWITLNAQQIIELVTIVREHVQACFDKEKALNDAIDNATTIEELNSISWNNT